MVCLSGSQTRFWDLDFRQSSDGYSLVVNTSRVRIRLSSGYKSPAKVEFDYSFGRLLYS